VEGHGSSTRRIASEAISGTADVTRSAAARVIVRIRRFYLAWHPHVIFQTASEKSCDLLPAAAIDTKDAGQIVGRFALAWSACVRPVDVLTPEAPVALIGDLGLEIAQVQERVSRAHQRSQQR